MKSRIANAAVVAVLWVQQVESHYYFNHLIANGTIFPNWKYVRPVLNGSGLPSDLMLPYPMYDPTSTGFRCGLNQTGSGAMTEIATLVAGSTVGFRPNFWQVGPGVAAWHDGPLQAYLARSPEQTRKGLKNWDGDGEYFKIAKTTPDDPRAWFYNTYHSNNTVNTWNFTLPLTTPPGLYLLRAESIYPHFLNSTQLYASCAQVEVVGPGGAKSDPGPNVKFPGAFDTSHPGVWVSEEVRKNWTLYQYPGPEVWTG
ncbi:lytic polysaccharide monooxygenase [Lentithecium fluviatile CBS 122367]|uniref:lytic cellulose monooxygenase (C4-dehydrogenating) n=1 Tax=Lentithecium fluviatile CBS 122367 TaxID=1168545 RepID=A0A6G1IYF9_9PLEO|nr:lytic polysaccharide monooxygenase [Lentithecium fluviatile CBS 122367]